MRRIAFALTPLLLAPFLALPASPVVTPTDMGDACTCVELFDALAAKVEANYPGYLLEIRGTDRAYDYLSARSTARAAADAAMPGLGCVAVLQDYVAWFRDGHLFVGGRPPVETSADSTRLRDAAPRVERDEADVLRYLDSPATLLDPVEGIWRDASGLEIAIVRENEDGAGDRFVAFVLSSQSDHWKPGEVKAELTALPDGSYDVVLYDDAHARTRPHVFKRNHAGGGRLQRGGLLLHMAPMTWGKLHPVRPGLEGRIDPVDPRAPTARLVGDDTVVFHVPSHVPAHAARLGALIEQYRGALGRASTMIVDLRGNEGGSAFVTNALMPFLITREKQPARYLQEGAPAVLTSADNVAFFERTSWAPPGLVERLRAAEPGTLVPFEDEPASPADEEATASSADVATDHPINVAILTDEMTVSAAEAFVLKAMRNGKVTLFGQPTGGSIDYQTVNIVSFGCPEAGLYVGYPTIVGSDHLPVGGTRTTGIVPDVRLDPADPDPIQRIIEQYAREASAHSGQ